MININEMKELAKKEKIAEQEVAKVQFEKDLAMYRDRLRQIKPAFIDYLEKRIYMGIKNNTRIGLYSSHTEDIFPKKYVANVLRYLCDTEASATSAYEVALKEVALEARNELFEAGVKEIKKNSNSCFMGEPYVILEV